MKNLVIVESPTKAKTIAKFLGRNYIVRSSMGHIRDLPRSKMGIDIENGFAPQYVVPKKNSKLATELKKLAKDSDKVILATDEDREGEAISWHLAEILKQPEEKYERITFHEITKEAIGNALQKPREIDMNLVDAQQARRVLDRLVGYELSPFLWKKVIKGLSAGRVQSVAVRLIVEREREIEAFDPQEYWTVEGLFHKEDSENKFEAKLNSINGKKLDKLEISSKSEADGILDELKASEFTVSSIEKKKTRRQPYAPFTTSTLQQEANRRLGLSSKQTMRLAQQLYEGITIGSQGSVGLITYMRTDSLNLADKFLLESGEYIKARFGDDHYGGPRRYKTKAKGAQEAHEAIRPTEASRNPDELKPYLNAQQYKLYKLIWQRAVASQMAEAVIDSTVVDISDTSEKYMFRANGSTIKFAGFMKVYPVDSKETILPELKESETVIAEKIGGAQHFTQPPARYSDATLVKALEEDGIGRPSTYAPTISTIIDRGYVERIEGRRLKPKEIAFLVIDLLMEHFPNIVDLKFTANMEEDLDEVAEGKKDWVPVITDFYMPFKENLDKKYDEVDKKKLTEEKTDEKCEKCGSPMVIKMGRFGKFLACSNYPECKNTKQLGADGKITEPEKTDEKCPNCGADMVFKHGRFGKFLACGNYPDCKTTKAITTGVKCPQCGENEIAEKRSRAGKTFYACTGYPNCKFALWSKPTGEKCPECGSLLVFAAQGKINCSNKECKFTKQAS